jgi:hypothetical protein
MKELDLHKIVAQDFISNGARCYSYNFNVGSGRFLPDGHKRRFDLLLFHENPELPSPIAIEVKSDGKFGTITRALHGQILGYYEGKNFTCAQEKWRGTPELLILLTETAYEKGIVYTTNFSNASNFYTERFAWRLSKKFGLLFKYHGDWWVSFQNTYYKLFGNVSISSYQLDDGKGERKDFRCLYDKSI